MKIDNNDFVHEMMMRELHEKIHHNQMQEKIFKINYEETAPSDIVFLHKNLVKITDIHGDSIFTKISNIGSVTYGSGYNPEINKYYLIFSFLFIHTDMDYKITCYLESDKERLKKKLDLLLERMDEC